MVKGTNKLNLQLDGFKSSILDSCKTPKVSIAGKLQIVPAPVAQTLLFQTSSGIPFLVFFLRIADVGQISLSRSKGDREQNPTIQSGGGQGGEGRSQPVDGVVCAISVSLDWFRARQAPVICWLQSSAVVRAVYSSPAWAVGPTLRACSLHCPTQAPCFILCHPSGWKEATGTGEQPV